jgi:hypothetical protein
MGIVLLDGDDARYYEMDRRYELLVGVRGQLRLSGQAALPEAK